MRSMHTESPAPIPQRSFCGWHLPVCFCVIAALFQTARATSIEIESSERRTWGDWTESWYSYADDGLHSASGTFDFSLSSPEIAPLFVNIASAPHGWERATSLVDPWNLEMTSDSAPMSIPFDSGLGALSPSAINISSAVKTLFSVGEGWFDVNIQGDSHFNYYGWEQEMGVTLKDVTSGSVVFSIFGLGQDVLSPFDYSYNFVGDSTHLYELDIFGRINSWDSKGVNMYTAVHLAHVPVADSNGSVLGMLVVSLGGLLWLRRT